MKKMQLFCIPYAGGNAGAFAELKECLQESAEVILLEYAGHGRRAKEAFYTDFDAMTQDIAGQIREKRNLQQEYAVLGYSMGSIVTYELFAGGYLEQDLPRCIFLAAHEAPDVPWECRSYVDLDDEAFMEKMLEFGGFSRYEPGMMQNKFFRRLYFQPLREDYRLLAQYRPDRTGMMSDTEHEKERTEAFLKAVNRLPVPVTMFYSPQDVPQNKIRSWDKFAGAGIEYVEIGTNHFFLQDRAEEMAEVISGRLNLPG